MNIKKNGTIKKNEKRREEILKSMIASFKIEGINISLDKALQSLKKVEINLGK
jgi:hypothetical protein